MDTSEEEKQQTGLKLINLLWWFASLKLSLANFERQWKREAIERKWWERKMIVDANAISHDAGDEKNIFSVNRTSLHEPIDLSLYLSERIAHTWLWTLIEIEFIDVRAHISTVRPPYGEDRTGIRDHAGCWRMSRWERRERGGIRDDSRSFSSFPAPKWEAELPFDWDLIGMLMTIVKTPLGEQNE